MPQGAGLDPLGGASLSVFGLAEVRLVGLQLPDLEAQCSVLTYESFRK